MSRREEAKRELLRRKCQRSPLFFFRNYVYIQHPQGRRLFEPREPQIEATLRWQTGSNSLTLKARQIGWSTLVACYVLWLVFFNPDKRVLLISKGEREAAELLTKVRFAYDHLPPWLRQVGPKLVNDNQTSMKFANGSEVLSLPSANNPGRGFTGALVIVDEWAFLQDPDAAWASIEPITDIGGQIIGLSTANGSGNFFHTLWERSEAGLTSFEIMFFPYNAVPERDDGWYEKKKIDLPSWQLHQEYPSNPREAFIKSGNPVFGEFLDKFEQLMRPGRSGEVVEWAGTLDFREGDGCLELWEGPIIGDVYVIGADVAEGLIHGDFSTADVVRHRTGEVVAKWRGHIEADAFGEDILYNLGRWYNNALVGPEANNHGLTTITALRRKGYPNIYRRRQLNTTGAGMGYQFGWQTTRTSKPLLVDELGSALRSDELIFHSAQTLKELYTFVRDKDGRMSGSPFDDSVISLGLANQMRKYVYQIDNAPAADTYMTVDWWADQIRQAKRPTGQDWVIGRRSVRAGR